MGCRGLGVALLAALAVCRSASAANIVVTSGGATNRTVCTGPQGSDLLVTELAFVGSTPLDIFQAAGCQHIEGSLTLYGLELAAEEWRLLLAPIEAITGTLAFHNAKGLESPSLQRHLVAGFSVLGGVVIEMTELTESLNVSDLTSWAPPSPSTLSIRLQGYACHFHDDLAMEFYKYSISLKQPSSCDCSFFRAPGECATECDGCPQTCGGAAVLGNQIFSASSTQPDSIQEGCALMLGNLTIEGSSAEFDLARLRNLQTVSEIRGDLFIVNTQLVAVPFLHNLERAKSIHVVNNSRLIDAHFESLLQGTAVEFFANPAACTGLYFAEGGLDVQQSVVVTAADGQLSAQAAEFEAIARYAYTGVRSFREGHGDLDTYQASADRSAFAVSDVKVNSTTRIVTFRAHQDNAESAYQALLATWDACARGSVDEGGKTTECQGIPQLVQFEPYQVGLRLSVSLNKSVVNVTWDQSPEVFQLYFSQSTITQRAASTVDDLVGEVCWKRFTISALEQQWLAVPICQDKQLCLQPGEHYILLGDGISEAQRISTQVVEVSTPRGEQVRNLVIVMDDDYIQASWQEPEGLASLAGYLVEVLDSRQRAIRQFVLPPTQFTMRYPRCVPSGCLDKGSHLYFSVQAQCTSCTAVVQPIQFRTPDLDAPTARALSIAPHVVSFDVSGQLSGRQIEVRVSRSWSTAAPVTFLIRMDFMLEVGPLVSNTAYEFEFRLVHEERRSPWSAMVGAVTLPVAPSRMEAPVLLQSAVSGQLYLEWRLAPHDGVEAAFDLRRVGADTILWTGVETRVPVAQAGEFVVRAVTKLGTSEWSAPSDEFSVRVFGDEGPDGTGQGRPRSSNNNASVIVGLSFAVVVLAVLALAAGLRAARSGGPPGGAGGVLMSTANFLAMTHTLDEEWEIERNSLVFGEQIGHGVSGVVLSGHIKAKGGKVEKVAIKLLDTEDNGRRAQEQFIAEADLMKGLRHPNIAELLGTCTRAEPILVVLKLCERGDLRTVLRTNRASSEGEEGFSLGQLLCMARDVAAGLAYLTRERIMHRDLAARNCLVNRDYSIAIGDFGRSMRLDTARDYYRVTGDGVTPVRWMAVESLKDEIYSPQSDLWSLGIVLFEVITLGSLPYAELTNQAVVQRVMAGYRLPCPRGCPDAYYRLMFSLWGDYNERPAAVDVSGRIEALLLRNRAEDREEPLGNSLDMWTKLEDTPAVGDQPTGASAAEVAAAVAAAMSATHALTGGGAAPGSLPSSDSTSVSMAPSGRTATPPPLPGPSDSPLRGDPDRRTSAPPSPVLGVSGGSHSPYAHFKIAKEPSIPQLDGPGTGGRTSGGPTEGETWRTSGSSEPTSRPSVGRQRSATLDLSVLARSRVPRWSTGSARNPRRSQAWSRGYSASASAPPPKSPPRPRSYSRSSQGRPRSYSIWKAASPDSGQGLGPSSLSPPRIGGIYDSVHIAGSYGDAGVGELAFLRGSSASSSPTGRNCDTLFEAADELPPARLPNRETFI